MYDILFIDDKFEQIKDTFWNFQNEYIRCFYSDGENNLPKNAKERLPFKNLKYISLDLHLENRGITTIKDKNAVSTLASVVKSFIDKDSTNIHIIINTSFKDEFNESKDNFIKYLQFNPTITTEIKNSNNSLLHKAGIKQNIINASHQPILRNLVIREAIEIENLIWNKLLSSNTFSKHKKVECILKELNVKITFSNKIDLYNKTVNNKSKSKLKKLRKLRNYFAHKPSPPQENLLDFLQEIESLKQEINS